MGKRPEWRLHFSPMGCYPTGKWRCKWCYRTELVLDPARHGLWTVTYRPPSDGRQNYFRISLRELNWWHAFFLAEFDHLQHSDRFPALPQGPSLRSGFCCPGPSSLTRPHPPHSRAHPDFTVSLLIPDALAVHIDICLGDPRLVLSFH